jgi:hypothetical protein
MMCWDVVDVSTVVADCVWCLGEGMGIMTGASPLSGVPGSKPCDTMHTDLCLERGHGVVGELSAAQPTCPPAVQERPDTADYPRWSVRIPGGPTAIDASDAEVVPAAEHVAGPVNGQA